jgi:hypothetical protein
MKARVTSRQKRLRISLGVALRTGMPIVPMAGLWGVTSGLSPAECLGDRPGGCTTPRAFPERLTLVFARCRAWIAPAHLDAAMERL